MELVTDEKIRTKVLRSALKEEGFKFDSWVRCIHCGRPFQGDEMRVFKEGDKVLLKVRPKKSSLSFGRFKKFGP